MAALPPPPARPPGRRLRPVLWLLLSLALIDAAVTGFRDTWERYSPDDYAERLRGCRSRPQDFVIVGGSPVSEGLDPAVIAGVRWRGHDLRHGYAMGLPGGTTSETYHAVRHGCPAPPKLLVYGITASDLNDDRNEPHGPYSLMTWADWWAWASARPGSAEWVTRRFLEGQLRRCWAAFRYRHGIRTAAAAAAGGWFPGCFPDAVAEARDNVRYADALRTGDGYAPASWFVAARYDEAKRTGKKLPPFGFLDKYRTGSHLTYLDKLADWAAHRGTDVVLVDMPVTADLEAKYPAAVAEYRERLAGFERRRGATVFRATREAVGLGDADFADTIHLNGGGARKLSGWLRDRLAEAGGGAAVLPAGPAARRSSAQQTGGPPVPPGGATSEDGRR